MPPIAVAAEVATFGNGVTVTTNGGGAIDSEDEITGGLPVSAQTEDVINNMNISKNQMKEFLFFI